MDWGGCILGSSGSDDQKRKKIFLYLEETFSFFLLNYKWKSLTQCAGIIHSEKTLACQPQVADTALAALSKEGKAGRPARVKAFMASPALEA